MKLLFKFTLVFVVVILPLLLFSMIFGIVYLRDFQTRNTIDRQDRIAQHAATEVEDFIALQFEVLEELSVVYLEPSLDLESKTTIIDRILFKKKHFIEIGVLDADGQEVLRKHRFRVFLPDDFRDRSDDPGFLASKTKNRFIGHLHFEFARPEAEIWQAFLGPRDEFLGAIVGLVDMRIMQEVVQKLTVVEEENRAYIINQSGVVIAHPDISQVLLEKDFSSIPIVAFALKKDPKIKPPLSYQNDIGQMVLGAFSPIDVRIEEDPPQVVETSWIMIAEQPTYLALASVRQITQFALILLVGVLIFIVVAAWRVAYWVIHPVGILHKVITEVRKGQFKLKANIKTGDEIEDLAIDFNAMIEDLGQSHAALEEAKTVLEIKVEARTKELRELAASLDAKVKQKTKELQEKMIDLEKFQRLTVGRELRMVELKEEIKKLEEGLEKNKPST